MKKYLISISALIAMCLAAPVAFADYTDTAKNIKCKVTISGDKVDCDGSVTGHDKHKDVKVVVIIKGKVTGDCINPGGNSPPPHRNKVVEFEETREANFKAGKHEIHFAFKKVTPNISAGDVCPNPNWSFENRKVKLFSVVVKVFQKNKLVATEHCL